MENSCFSDWQLLPGQELGDMRGNPVSIEETEHCNGFFLCRLLKFGWLGRSLWFGNSKTV